MFGPDSKHPKISTAAWSDFCQDNFWVCTKGDSMRGNNRGNALMGDAYRSLFNAWKYDISEVKCPTYIFQGQYDEDMGSSNPAAPEFVKQMIPHAVYEEIPGAGHMSCTGPNDHTRKLILKAVENMPALT